MSTALEITAEKLELLDKLFNAMTVDEIKDAIGADLVVGKLRDSQQAQGPIEEIIDELTLLRKEIVNLTTELNVVKHDIFTIIKLISKPHDANSYNDMSSLKVDTASIDAKD